MSNTSPPLLVFPPFLGVFLLLTSTMADNKELYLASNQFGIEFYQAVKDSSANLVCSPLSLQIALMMTYAGSDGVTAREMEKVLHMPANGRSQVLSWNKMLMEQLKDPVLKIANKLYVEETTELKQQFQSDLVAFFESEVDKVNFVNKPAEAAAKINHWVEEKTNNKIKDLISQDSINPDTRLILINAIHFKANWKSKFNEANTYDGDFHVNKKKQIKVKMMFQKASFNYGYDNELQAKILEMPYAGDNFSMVIILPDDIEGLAAVEAKLAKKGLEKVISKLYPQTVEVRIPRFKIESELDLVSTMQKLGMSTLFTDAANLSGIADVPLKVSKIIQKAMIEVNEEGTEAAAATGVDLMLRTVVWNEEFNANHPFLYWIQHVKSKSILFEGKFVKKRPKVCRERCMRRRLEQAQRNSIRNF